MPTATVPVHADAIRFALIGQPVDVNAWAWFDEEGADYATRALHSDEYPRLYRLSVPAREFEAFIAEGRPSAIAQDGDLLSATVRLRPSMQWSDGSPLTARDVAFTVNTALGFRLGLDWRSAYDPARLDHAEALDDLTVKFYFKGPLDVGDWQYGALQGPILSQAFWSPKLTGASALLPGVDLLQSLDAAKARAAELQGFIDADNTQLLKSLPNSADASELRARIQRHQDDLNAANSQTAKLQDEVDSALAAARAALYALEDDGEPTFGPFLRAEKNGRRSRVRSICCIRLRNRITTARCTPTMPILTPPRRPSKTARWTRCWGRSARHRQSPRLPIQPAARVSLCSIPIKRRWLTMPCALRWPACLTLPRCCRDRNGAMSDSSCLGHGSSRDCPCHVRGLSAWSESQKRWRRSSRRAMPGARSRP